MTQGTKKCSLIIYMQLKKIELNSMKTGVAKFLDNHKHNRFYLQPITSFF